MLGLTFANAEKISAFLPRTDLSHAIKFFVGMLIIHAIQRFVCLNVTVKAAGAIQTEMDMEHAIAAGKAGDLVLIHTFERVSLAQPSVLRTIFNHNISNVINGELDRPGRNALRLSLVNVLLTLSVFGLSIACIFRLTSSLALTG